MTPIHALIGVLFIGHSLFGKTNPQMLKQVLQAQSSTIQVEAQIINGAPLKYNWSHSADGEGVDARVEIPKAKYNAVILTEAIPLANHLRWSQSAENALNFYELAVSANPQTQVYLQETWHSLDSGTGRVVKHDDNADVAWRDRLDQDLPLWQGIVDDVNAAKSEDAPAMQLLPAGQAMARLNDQIEAGTVPGLDDIRDVFSDDIHPNDIGFYFLTMVQYSALTGQSSVGLPHRLKSKYGEAYTAPSPELAVRLQEIAQNTVAAFYGVTLSSAPDPAPQPVARTSTVVEHPVGPVPMAVGLAGVKDWSVQQPFLDVMKTARSWIGHKPGQWGGIDYDEMVANGDLDAQGWPTSMPAGADAIGTLILTDLPPQAVSLAGRYRLRFEGTGIVEAGGRATNVRYGKNEVQFDFTPGEGSVDIRIQRTDRRNTGDYVRNITVVKLDNVADFDVGAMFNPDWTAQVGGFGVFRFMDWMRTNHSTQSNWDNRPRVDDFSYAPKGVPAEIMIALANELKIDPWFNMPHLAEDDYVTRFATLVRDTLDADLRAYVEFSNEVWNWQFAQAHWADEQALARWQQKDRWMQYYGLRASEVARIWSQVYAGQADARLVNVISTQTGWKGLEKQSLLAPLLTAEPGSSAIPAAAFDAYAVAGYFGRILGTPERTETVKSWISDSHAAATKQADDQALTGDDRIAYIADHAYDQATLLAGQDMLDGSVSGDTSDTLTQLLGEVFPYHAEVARQYNLDLIMYEGGSHVVGVGLVVDDPDLTGFFTHLNYSDAMGELYVHLINGWHQAGGKLFNAYSDVMQPSKWGSWGALRYLSDDNPRWRALVQFQ